MRNVRLSIAMGLFSLAVFFSTTVFGQPLRPVRVSLQSMVVEADVIVRGTVDNVLPLYRLAVSHERRAQDI